MKNIPLTQGKIALVDDADFERLNRWKWFAMQSSSRYTFYAKRTVYVAGDNQGAELMHRLILGLRPGDKRQTDHIDGDGLNNQQSNLRVCTVTQNNQSSRKRKIATSSYKGVRWSHDNGKWRSEIQVNKKNIHLGYFDSEIAAAQVYDLAAIKYFNNFALTNKMLGLIRGNSTAITKE